MIAQTVQIITAHGVTTTGGTDYTATALVFTLWLLCFILGVAISTKKARDE